MAVTSTVLYSKRKARGSAETVMLAEAQALYSRVVGRYTDVQAGRRSLRF